MKTPNNSPRRARRYVVAMLLGTALSALGTAPALSAQPPETAVQVVNDLSRYCTACWRNARLPPDCWGDCTQEVLSRLLENIPTPRWNGILQGEGEDRQELVRAIDAVKKRTQRALRRSHSLVGVVSDGRASAERQRADEREAVQRAATELLTARQQRILQLSFEGWEVQEIAQELQLPPSRVSDEKYKAIRKLRTHLTHSEREQA